MEALRRIETFVFNEDQLKDLQKSPELKDLMKKANSFIVKSHDDSAAAITMGAKLSKFIKWVENKRLEVTRPFVNKQKEIKAAVDEFLAEIIAAENNIKQSNMSFVRAEQERVVEETRKAEVEQKRKENISLALGGDGVAKTPTPMPVPVSVINPTKMVKRWKYKVVDEAKVPRKYLQINAMLIGGDMMTAVKKAGGGNKATIEDLPKIAGIEFFQEENSRY